MRIGKLLKKLGKLVILLVVFGGLYFGYLYLKYHEDLPIGKQGVEADALANRMLEALDYEAYKNTSYIEWTYRDNHHFKWQKYLGICDVFWKDYKVTLHLNDLEKSKAYVHNFAVVDEKREELINKALVYFNNDSFWLVAPYKVMDPGVERQIITRENNKKELLITFVSGGTTPGDSYLWSLDENGKPLSFKMWTSVLPINGLQASWSDWTTTNSGAQLPTGHRLLFLNLEIKNIKGLK
jgi:hypothetical protein